MKILGIDPGLEVTGFACIKLQEDFNLNSLAEYVLLLEHGVIQPKSNQPVEERLKYIHSNLKKLLLEIKPEVVAVEDIYSSSLHPQTGLKMGHVKGVVELAVSQSGIKLSVFSNSKVKKALTGRGNATKEQVAKVIQQQFRLKGNFSEHESDAIAIALTYIYTNPKRIYI